ncbi:MAG: hypothetical protein GAK31_03810 [Stenotrophomonas maltophilia]|uniref:Sel1 repeat family protein n=1 Tax=Stenotrophomonas maltophilia TaxID=40324 RepID=A0A7V8JJY2_STEMA|nr:MAG: hypothetical protein GAK31_03810 [Stenotrophomonas maltophilia]
MPAFAPRTLIAAFITLVLLLPCAQIAAATGLPRCGLFEDESGDNQLRVDGPDRGVEKGSYISDRPFVVQHSEGSFNLVGLTFGLVSDLKVQRDGRALQKDDKRYRLTQPAACLPPAEHAPGSCLADARQCLYNHHELSLPALESGCAEGVPQLCQSLPDRYRKADQAPGSDTPTEAQIAVIQATIEKSMAEVDFPRQCRDDDPAADAEACMAIMEERPELVATLIRTASMAASMVELFSPADKPKLSDARLQRLQGLCTQVRESGFCMEVAMLQWDAGNLQEGRAALQVACDGGDETSCRQATALLQLGAHLVPQAARAVPCGRYVAPGGMLDELTFGDGGMVEVGFGSRVRARVEDGQIRMRHEAGGDYVLQPLANGDLLGLDDSMRFERFQRQPGDAQCSAPLEFDAVPFPQDCPCAPIDGEAEACCAAGRMQGCNVLGSRAALDGKWIEASQHYQKVCQAGIREGCENLVGLMEISSRVDVRPMLEAVCEADGSGRHVACDVLATRNWGLLGFGQALERAVQEQSADEDRTIPAPRTPNHKQ